MTPNLGSLTYRQATLALLEAGYVHFASGDWSLVFHQPGTNHILKISPYDPAYLVFANLCSEHPHPNLPHIQSIPLLQRNGFVVETPRCSARNRQKQQGFLDSLRSAFEERETSDIKLKALSRILREGLKQAETLPYFSGIDWNPKNVLFDGSTPKFVDAFNISGSQITKRLDKGDPVDLNEIELADFLTIPYHCPNFLDSVGSA